MPNNKGGKKYKKNKKDTITNKVLIKRTTDSELYGRVTKICGSGRFMILCTDGIERLGIIRGKLRKRMWIVLNNIVLVDIWQFQDSKCSIVHVYDESQIDSLRELNEITDSIIKTDDLTIDIDDDDFQRDYDLPIEDESSDSESDNEINLDDI